MIGAVDTRFAPGASALTQSPSLENSATVESGFSAATLAIGRWLPSANAGSSAKAAG